MKYLFLCLILVLGSSALLALPRIAYIGASAILPGSGELLLGYNNRGGTHLAVEVLSITGYILTGREMDLIEKNYQEYASAYAGVLASQSDNYYQDLQD
ncbi:MAG: hypothetical protein PHI68_06375, partial [Candidatus Cloacimonetes bacterium]|nr:hypothetical protein [Candidatus Cloacimonadota bacterium]